MALNFPVRKSDLLGSTRLVTEATAGVTDLVEAMHERIARLPGMPSFGPEGRTSGITGFVYDAVRGITRAVGLGVEALLEALVPPIGSDDPDPGREAVISALNGVLGDHLVATGNPLAKTMALRRDGRPLVLDREALGAAIPDVASGVVVLIHGLCMGDLQWNHGGRDRGGELARDLGLTPIWLDYDSGLHVCDNGRRLAELLESLAENWPRPLERIVLIGHSMGGLVARSAFHQAGSSGLGWPKRVSDMVFLGSPHHGAPLEKAGHWLDVVLGATPYAAPFTRLGRIRSAGITDMRHGRLLEEDRQARAGVGIFGDTRRPVPLPEGVRSWAIAASAGRGDGDPTDHIVGDGLVPLDSALGRHRDPARRLAFPDDHQRVIRGIGHLDLLWDDEVFDQLHCWLGQPAAAPVAG